MAELDRAKMFNENTWLYYLLCSGCSIGPISPLIAADEKNLCIHETCTTVSIGGDDGLCYAMENCLCITEHFAIPPAKGTRDSSFRRCALVRIRRED